MRIRIYIVIVLSFCVLSCNSEKKRKEDKSIQLTQEKTEGNTENSNNLSKLYQQEIVETIFNEFRVNEKLNKAKKDFVVQEQINFNGTKFNYVKITIPVFELLRIQSADKYISISDLTPESKRRIVLDTTTIEGLVTLKNYQDKKSMQLLFTGTWNLKANVLQEYDVIGQREFKDIVEFQQNIDLTTSKTYHKKDFYLKARISELNRSDLISFTKDELSYLRNEIFARYGHVFKTDKMKNYFNKQPWYTPLFMDATELLNEIEKKNIQLIKQLES